MGDAVALLSRDELCSIVREVVRAEMGGVRHAEEREILTREQAAEIFEVHPNVLVRYVRCEGLPAYKVGPEWRFKRSEIIAWLDQRAVRPGAHTARAAKKIRAAKGGA